MVTLFEQCGEVLLILLALSTYMSGIIIFKAYQFWKLNIHEVDFVTEITNYVKLRNIDAAMAVANQAINPLARVIESALRCISVTSLPKDLMENEVAITGNKTILDLESHIQGLQFVGKIAPLVGLLGTLVVAVHVSYELEQLSPPSELLYFLSSSVRHALFPLVFGLTLSIASRTAESYIKHQIERFRMKMSETTSRILLLKPCVREAGSV